MSRYDSSYDASDSNTKILCVLMGRLDEGVNGKDDENDILIELSSQLE